MIYPAGSAGAAMEQTAKQPLAQEEAKAEVLDPAKAWPFPARPEEFDVNQEQ